MVLGHGCFRSLSQTNDYYVYLLQRCDAVHFWTKASLFGRNFLPSSQDQTDQRTQQKTVILIFTAVKASHP
jgi:hypothetical protein